MAFNPFPQGRQDMGGTHSFDDGLIEEVISILALELDADEEELSLDSTRDEFVSWTPRRVRNVVRALEQVFSIHIDPGEVERVASVRDIVEIVEARLAGDMSTRTLH